MKQWPQGIFSIGIGETKDIKYGREKTVQIEKGFIGIPKKVKIKMIDTYPHFSVWHLATGRHVYENVPACQFHVFQKINNNKVVQSLSAHKPKGLALRSFKWKYPKGQ